MLDGILIVHMFPPPFTCAELHSYHAAGEKVYLSFKIYGIPKKGVNQSVASPHTTSWLLTTHI